jgi:hypothetical protein
VGSVSYRVQLSAHVKIHNVFHVGFLKKFEGTSPSTTPPLPSIVHCHVVPVPERVMRARPTWDLLVQWQGHTIADASCQELAQFKEAYPNFKLEDELFCQGGGSVVDSFFHNQYTCMSKTNKGKESISG